MRLILVHDFIQVIRFLKRSEIFYAISAKVDIYENRIREFWKHVVFKVKDDRKMILSIVQGQKIEITERLIQTVLQFNDDGNYLMKNPELYGIIEQMGYEGDRNSAKLVKGQIGYNWKYIWHVVIHVFAARNSGWDNLNRDLAIAIACLCTFRPFNWAGMIFGYMQNNANNELKSKLFLYPRFLQLIFNYKLKNLNHEGHILELADMRNRIFKDMKNVHPKSTFSGKFTDLFEKMKTLIAREAHRLTEEHVVVEEVEEEEEEEEEREYDPRSRKFVKKVSGAQRRIIDESSESDTESDNEPIDKSKGKSPRIVIKKSASVPTVVEKPKRKLVKRADSPVVQKKQNVEIPRPSIPSSPSSSP